jgi:hypothetical protein
LSGADLEFQRIGGAGLDPHRPFVRTGRKAIRCLRAYCEPPFLNGMTDTGVEGSELAYDDRSNF